MRKREDSKGEEGIIVKEDRGKERKEEDRMIMGRKDELGTTKKEKKGKKYGNGRRRVGIDRIKGLKGIKKDIWIQNGKTEGNKGL